MWQVWRGSSSSQEHHDDADEQQTYQDEAEIDEQVLEVLTRLLRHLDSGGSPDGRAGEVLDFLHAARKAEVGRQVFVSVKRKIKRRQQVVKWELSSFRGPGMWNTVHGLGSHPSPSSV